MILTSGPFPTGQSADRAVEQHLERCDSCHELAEALRPLPEFAHEAVSPEESRWLPGYRSCTSPLDDLSDFEYDLSPTIERPMPPQLPIHRETDMVANLIWFAIAVVCGVMAAGTVTAIIGTAT